VPVAYSSIHILAWLYLVLCFLSTGWIAVDEIRHPQRMWIMALVWPLSALYLGPFAVWLYRRTRSKMTRQPDHQQTPMLSQRSAERLGGTQVMVAASHCGAGCALGDIIGETAVPLLGLAFAGEFGSKLIVDFVVAFVLGIAFQYFTIVPMRGLSFSDGLKTALRADTISIVTFEIGMFGWMALSYFVLFPAPHLNPSQIAFWFMMQVAMIAGYVTSLPANAWLIHKGWKEKMPKQEPPKLPQQQTLRAA
jgi:hypothetical protein